MSFGLSLGDFITVGKLISDIVISLRGAEEDYQELLCELSSLQTALHHVDKLKSSDKQQPALEAIKCAALACQLPLSNFLVQAQKYEGSLGAGRSNGLFRDLEKKSRWAFCKKEDGKQLRDYLNVHVGSINMMLMTHGLEMLTVAGKQAKEDNEYLQKGLECSRNAVQRVREDMKAQQVVLHGNTTMLGRVFGTISGDVVPQLKALVDMATRVWQMNIQIYEIVLKSQTMAARPDLRHTWFQEPVRLEDALGRIFPIPSEYGYSTVEAIIRDKFQVGPGRQKVVKGEYELFDARNSNRIISGSAWTGLLPGMNVKMAVTLEQHYTQKEYCPMPNCGSQTFITLSEGGKVCSGCNVWFEVAPHVSNPSHFFLQSTEQRAANALLKAEEISDEIEASHVTEDDVSTETEVSAELEAFKNVRVKRTDLPFRVGSSEVIWTKKSHPLIAPSSYVVHLSVVSVITVEECRDLLVISCVCGRQWYLDSPGQPPHAPEKPQRRSSYMKPAMPLQNSSVFEELTFKRCTFCAWWYHPRCVEKYQNPIDNFCRRYCPPGDNELNVSLKTDFCAGLLQR